MINKQTQLNTLLGEWRDNGFTIKEEANPLDEDDALVCLYFKGQRTASYYSSKLPDNITELSAFIRKQCKTYWDNCMRAFTRGV